MEELINTIKTVQADFGANADAFLKGNKAAGLRARKNTLMLATLYKQFRAESVKATK